MNCIFICVNYNGSVITENFLASISFLERIDPITSSIAIVVDNASNPADISNLESLVSQHQNSRLIKSDINLGYFGGLNIGLSEIDTSKFDFVIICNNDITFEKNFTKELASRKYQPEIFVIAPNVITADGYHQNPHCIERVSTFRKFLYRIYYINFFFARLLTIASNFLSKLRGGRSNNSAENSQFVHMGIGACYVLTPSFFQNHSLLDDSVFLYGEEALLAGQVMSAGGKIYYDSKLVVHHAESATLSKLPSKKVYDFARQSYPKYKRYL